MAEFRGWDRLIAWRSPVLAADRIRLPRRLLTLPIRAAREARHCVQRAGAEVEAASGRSRASQARQLWWLGVRHGVDTPTYLDFQLYRPDRARRAGDYLRSKEFLRVGRFLNTAAIHETDAWMLHDKRQFGAWCRSHGFPSAAILIEWDKGEVVYSDLPPDALTAGVLPPVDLFSKPANSTSGYGTGRWLWDGHGAYVPGHLGADTRPRTAAELLEELAEVSRTLRPHAGRQATRLLLQQHLHNDPALRDVTRGAIASVRIVTYRWPGQPARVCYAAFKMPVGASAADNLHAGGVAAAVDLATGRTGPAVRRVGRLLTPVTHHPDTGTVVAGRVLPHWDAALALCARTHDALRCVPSVGWDVALTPEGPAFLEGNPIPNPDIGQTTTGRPLADTDYVACINAHVRAAILG
jgi:hypothetical protein